MFTETLIDALRNLIVEHRVKLGWSRWAAEVFADTL